MGKEELKKRASTILRVLSKQYPDARCLLDFRSPFELLIATVLAAQCTDARVNEVAPSLFKKYPTPEAFARANIRELEEDVRPTGFFRNKARSVKASSQALLEKFGGKVPRKIEDLVSLPGIGRKTANVVLGYAFGLPAIIVDTHFLRVTQRIGLTKAKVADKVEMDLRTLVPEKSWTRFSSAISFQGRSVCFARKPECEICKIRRYCDYAKK